MYAFCTYCSKDKSTEPSEIPAIQRYLSPRIDHVYSAARELGLGFFILSGEYGLLPPEQPIPWYDHLLKPEEVPNLTNLLTQQIKQYGITRLVYYTQSFARDPHIVPYHDAVVGACQQAGVLIFVVEIDETSLTSQAAT